MASHTLMDKVVFVTGSARRVGKMIALAYAAAGANVVIHHSNSPDAAAATAQEARALGVQALVIQGNHTDPLVIANNFATIKSHFGQLDVLVNSAGAFKQGDILDIPAEEWQYVVDLNISAPFYCTQHAGRMMRDQGTGGSIINIADNGGLRPWHKRPHHGISKASVVMLTQVAAKGLAQHNIRVNCVVPGPVLIADDMSDDYWEYVEQRVPLERSGTPEDVARACIFLSENDFITGAILRVDGGEFLGTTK